MKKEKEYEKGGEYLRALSGCPADTKKKAKRSPRERRAAKLVKPDCDVSAFTKYRF